MTLLVLALFWLLGVGAAALGAAGLWFLALPLGLGAAFGLLFAGRPGAAALAVLAALLLSGAALRYEGALSPGPAGGIATFNEGPVLTIAGTVVTEPEDRGRSQRFQVRVERIRNPASTVSGGKVLVTVRPFPRFRYGDRVTLTGKLRTPESFDTFDYRDFLARQGVVSLADFPRIQREGGGGGSDVQRALWSVRRPLATALERALPEPEAALAEGILLGIRSSIPRGLTDDLNAAGISHIVAISGYNVTIVAGLAVAALRWPLGRRRATAAAAVIVIAFVLFVGASPSVLRAGVMGIVMLGASLVGRPGSVMTAIAVSAALLTAISPRAIDDVAFQLSFAATAGLALLAEPLSSLFRALLRRALPEAAGRVLADSAGVTLAANIAVIPIIGSTFGRVSLMAVPANLVAAPLVPLILCTSALTAAGGAIFPAAASVLGSLALPPLSALIAVGQGAAAIPGSVLSFSGAGAETAAALYAATAALALLLMRVRPRSAETQRPRRLGLAFAAAAVAVVAAITWSDVLDGESGRLRVSLLDVGQGEAVLITTPSGYRVLVDGGPSGPAIDAALGHELPAGARRFDLVVLTHAQDDHVSGLVEVAERYHVRSALLSPREGQTAAYREFRATLDRHGAEVSLAFPGEWLDLGHGVRLEVLGPLEWLLQEHDDGNDSSVVLRLVYGSVSFLLTGDLGVKGETALLAEGGDLHATVLKVGHHGSAGSTSSDFVDAVRPSVAAISVGAENSFGHPSPSTLLRLAGLPIFRTDRNGTLRFETDGRRLWAGTERGSFQVVDPRQISVGP